MDKKDITDSFLEVCKNIIEGYDKYEYYNDFMSSDFLIKEILEAYISGKERMCL